MSNSPFKSNEDKSVTFTVECKEVKAKDLEAYFRIGIGGVEYSFPGNIKEDNKIEFNIPALEEVVKQDFSSGQYQSKLDVYAQNFHTQVWKGNVEIQVAPKVGLSDVVETETANTSVSFKGMETNGSSPSKMAKDTPSDQKASVKRLESTSAKNQKASTVTLDRAIDKKIREGEEEESSVMIEKVEDEEVEVIEETEIQEDNSKEVSLPSVTWFSKE